jgi:outer membrane receptor protein involved in Fe transport
MGESKMSKKAILAVRATDVALQPSFTKKKLAAAVALASGLCVPGAVVAEDGAQPTVEEIIVTARKRESNIQDTSVSIQAFTEDDIERLDINRFEDFAEQSPSVSYVSAGPATQLMHIRGVSDGGIPHVFRTNVATATFYLDEQPITGRGGGVPDLHLYDIERIEVLRGPEGTYYGASSVSGTVRIITNKPDPEEFSYGTDITGGTIDDGETTYTGEGFVNIPVSDTAALRVVGWYDKSNGFVDNVPVTRTYSNGFTVNNSRWADDDYNEEETKGARASFMAFLNDQWTLQIGAMTQSMDTVGAWDHDPTRYSDLEVARFGPEFSEVDSQQFSLTLEGDLGIGDLVYAGSYYDREDLAVNDYSDYVEYASFSLWIQQHACEDFYWYGFTGCGDPSIFFESEDNSTRTSHEIRLSSAGDSGNPLNWIVGAYYEKNEYDGFLFWEMPGINFDSGPADYYISGAGATPLENEWWSCPGYSGENSEKAIFGEVSYDFTDKLTVAVGMRAFESEFGESAGFSCGYPWEPKVYSEGGSDTYRDESFKVNVSYAVSDDLLVYGAFGQGFRRGGANPDVSHPEVPEIFDADGIDSYEFGWKATLADNRVYFNGAAYYMDWDNFQTVLYDLLTVPFNFRRNVEGATVTGIEMDLLARLGQGWTVTGGLAFNDAELVDDFSTIARDPRFVYAEDGRRLAHVPEWKATLGMRYDFTFGEGAEGYGQVNWSYTDERWNLLARQSESAPVVMDAYDTIDLRVGADFDNGSWGAELFVTNLTNEHAEIFRNTGYYDPRVTTTQPRTIGLRFKIRS